MISVDIAAKHPKMGSPDLPWPIQKSDRVASYDCHAAIDEPLEMWPGRLAKVPLGFALMLPKGWQAQIRLRTDLATQGILIPDSPSTVDAEHQGEVSALLCCLPQYKREGHDAAGLYLSLDSATGVCVQPGDQIFQMAITPVADVAWHHISADRLRTERSTERGKGGLGSTGTVIHATSTRIVVQRPEGPVSTTPDEAFEKWGRGPHPGRTGWEPWDWPEGIARS